MVKKWSGANENGTIGFDDDVCSFIFILIQLLIVAAKIFSISRTLVKVYSTSREMENRNRTCDTLMILFEW